MYSHFIAWVLKGISATFGVSEATLDGAEGVCALEKLNSEQNNLEMRHRNIIY
jgi:hypothetical protein